MPFFQFTLNQDNRTVSPYLRCLSFVLLASLPFLVRAGGPPPEVLWKVDFPDYISLQVCAKDYVLLYAREAQSGIALVNNRGVIEWQRPGFDFASVGNNGTIYVAGSSQISSIDRTNRLNWSINTPRGLVTSFPAITLDNGSIYVPINDYTYIPNGGYLSDAGVFKVSARGDPIWLKGNGVVLGQGGSSAASVTKTGRLYVVFEPSLLAFDKEGNLLWKNTAYRFLSWEQPIVGPTASST